MRFFLIAAITTLIVACDNGDNESASISAVVIPDANSTSWSVDKARSKLGFSATQNGNRFEGVFTEYEAQIFFDPKNLSDASVNVSIKMDSAETGDRQRDSALSGADWFKVKEFPTAKFISTDIKLVGDGNYQAIGALTIKDITKDIVLPFTLNIEDDTATSNGSVTLVRTDFGVGQGEFSTEQWVGFEVDVSIDVVATR